MGKKYSDKTQNHTPYYINTGGKIEFTPNNIIENNNEPVTVTVPKFKFGIDKNSNALVTIDNVLHFLNNRQFHAFTLACINVNKKVNPEIDYSKALTR